MSLSPILSHLAHWFGFETDSTTLPIKKTVNESRSDQPRDTNQINVAKDAFAGYSSKQRPGQRFLVSFFGSVFSAPLLFGCGSDDSTYSGPTMTVNRGSGGSSGTEGTGGTGGEAESAAGNQAPVFEPLENQIIDEGEEFRFPIPVYDPDGDSLNVWMEEAQDENFPEGAYITAEANGQFVFNWTPIL